MTTAPTEIAARMTIATKIGVSGEEPPLSSVEEAGFAAVCAESCEPWPEPLD